jgi:hypothetical protein
MIDLLKVEAALSTDRPDLSSDGGIGGMWESIVGFPDGGSTPLYSPTPSLATPVLGLRLAIENARENDAAIALAPSVGSSPDEIPCPSVDSVVVGAFEEKENTREKDAAADKTDD